MPRDKPTTSPAAHDLPIVCVSGRMMAEALAALSLACNVFQIIGFAHEVYNFSKETKATGSSDAEVLVSLCGLLDLNGV